VLEFEKCLDRTEPVPWAVIREKIRVELGRPLEDVFSSVDPVPLASASVAQVHAAGDDSQPHVLILQREPDGAEAQQGDM
jgi:aarF domain-containing kinase